MMEKRQPLQQMLLEKLDSAYRKLKVDPCLSSYTSIKSKWIKDLNIKPENLKLCREYTGTYRHRQQLLK
jgi:hypothetical protein